MSGNDVVGFTSARIRTQDKLLMRYGRIEARIKVPDLDRGLWPAFWTLGNSFSTVGWPDCGEIDIMEMGSYESILDNRTNRQVASTAHWENQGGHAFFGLSLVVNQDLTDDFHLFTLDWTPSLLTTYLDGQKIWEMDITPGSCTDCTEFHEPHFIILNVAVGGTYPQMRTIGAINAPLPAEMRVDYVRVYDTGFTEISGPASEPAPAPRDSLLQSVRERAAGRIADILQQRVEDCGNRSCNSPASAHPEAGSQTGLIEFAAPDDHEPTAVPALKRPGLALLTLMILGIAYRAIR
jgi:beta-glucanase (GH16 family)